MIAFPWISEENFELGTRGHFDATTNGNSKLDFPHYSVLAQTPGLSMPYSGAYCLRSDLSLGTSDAYIQETGDWDMTTGSAELYLRFMLWVDPKITMADTNEFAILQFWSSTNTVETGVYINFTTANGLRIGYGEASASVFTPLTTNTWHAVEIFFNPAGSSAGAIDMTFDGTALTQVGSITNASITSGIVGTVGIDAGTTAGVILFDSIISDDAQIYFQSIRYPETIVMTKSGHAFAGPGVIDNVTLLSSATADCALAIYDTDVANTNDTFRRVVQLRNTAAANGEIVDPAGMPAEVRRGCYVALSGTADAAGPQAILKIKRAPAYFSDGAIRNYGLRRKAAPGGV